MPVDLASQVKDNGLNLVDCRRPTEFTSGHIEGAASLPLDYINQNMNQVDNAKQYHIYCASGYRSVIMASILKSRNYNNVVNVVGGFEELKKTDMPIESGGTNRLTNLWIVFKAPGHGISVVL